MSSRPRKGLSSNFRGGSKVLQQETAAMQRYVSCPNVRKKHAPFLKGNLKTLPPKKVEMVLEKQANNSRRETQSGLKRSAKRGWKPSQPGQTGFKCVLFLGFGETDSCRESLRCADPTQTFPAPVKYHNSEGGIKLQHAAAFNLGRNTPFKSWNGKTASRHAT